MLNRCENKGCKRIVIFDRNLKYPVIKIPGGGTISQKHMKLCKKCVQKVEKVVAEMAKK